MINLVRIDNRLIHGQVIETWVPHLKAGRVVVADDEAAGSPLIRAAMGLAAHRSMEVRVLPLGEVDWPSLSADPVRTLVLLREIGAALSAQANGLALARLNVGNVHFAPGRVQITPSVFLSPTEAKTLIDLAGEGVAVEVRAVPSDRPMGPAEVRARVREPG